MNIEVYLSPKSIGSEIPFSIATGTSEDDIYLYSNHDNTEYKYKLINENGSLRLESENPFCENDNIIKEKLVGISTDWLEAKSQGFEGESNFVFVKEPGYGPDDIFVENKPFSLRQIYDLIKYGDIELSPDFQRNFVWDKTRQSRLIESILLGLPLPSIYLSQYMDGRLTIVDGLQRITTIKRFLDNELTLHNLEYLEECNGKKYDQLEGILSPLRLRKFGQTQVMCFVIDYRSPSKLKFDLFRRLNTGGKPLNNQEIRNCLSLPKVQNVLRKMIESGSFYRATNGSVSDNRMEAREAALRFIYFYDQYMPNNTIGKYNGDMESTLDDFIDELNLWSEEELSKYISIYENSLKIARYLFGGYCFRKVLPEYYNRRRAPINKLLMLTVSVLLSRYNIAEVEDTIEMEGALTEQLADYIEENEEFFNAMSWGTNGKWNIEIGFHYLKSFFDTYL